MADPSPELVERTVVWPFGRHSGEMSVRRKLAEMLLEVYDRGARTIGISQIAFRNRKGEIIDDWRADNMLLRMVSDFMYGPEIIFAV